MRLLGLVLVTLFQCAIAQFANPECSAHPACNRDGPDQFCCPTLDGTYLECCTGQVGAECNLYPDCVAKDAEGFCCPSVEGEFLDCCGDTAPPPPLPLPTDPPAGLAACSAYPGCAHLDNDCCPNAEGKQLACCGETLPPVPVPTDPPAGSAACSAYPACAHLDNDCCPNAEGKQLACCGETLPPVPVPTDPPAGLAACSAYPACAHLDNDCCPNAEGKQLACCDGTYSIPIPNPNPSPSPAPSSCSAYPVCIVEDMDPEDDCCPTIDNTRLACCDGTYNLQSIQDSSSVNDEHLSISALELVNSAGPLLLQQEIVLGIVTLVTLFTLLPS